MNIVITPLRPDNKADFARLLEGADFDHAPEWKSCFCRYYHTSCSFPEWIKRTADENKTESLAEIDAGRMKGYLAYDGAKPVGWLNANHLDRFPRLTSVNADLPKGLTIGVSLCFVVDPNYRGKGIAGKLLDAAIEGFREAGMDAVIALPFVDLKEERMYRGRTDMYLRRGFVQRKEENGVVLVYLPLTLSGKAVMS
jgi:GNAT superfamily N-acetyltransferase